METTSKIANEGQVQSKNEEEKVEKQEPTAKKDEQVQQSSIKIPEFSEAGGSKISSINQTSNAQNTATVQDPWFDDTFDLNRQQSQNEDEQSDITSTNSVLKDMNQEKQAHKKRKYVQKAEKMSKKESNENSQANQQKAEQEWISQTMEIDQKYLLIAYFMYRQDIQNIIPKNEGKIYIIPNKKGEIKVSAKSKQLIQKYIEAVSDFINKIEVIIVKVKIQFARKMIYSRKLRQTLRKEDLCLVMDDQYGKSELYLGGKQKQKIQQKQKLEKLFKKQNQLKSYQFYELRLNKYLNTRSYRIIFDLFFSIPEMNQIWKQKFKTQNVQRVSPTIAQKYSQHDESHFIHILLTSESRLNSVHYKQYEKFLYDLIKTQFYCITLLFLKGKYIEKMSLQNVFFSSADEQKFNYSYLYIVLSQQKYADSMEGLIKILENLEKTSGKIIGVRFFRNIAPEFQYYKRKQGEYCLSYPKQQPYSWVVRAKKGFQLNWKEYLLSLK